MMRFEITGLTFSVNKLDVGRTWQAQAARRKKLRQQMAWQILAEIQKAGYEPWTIPEDPPGRMRVTLTIFRPRRFDPDNVHGGTTKIILDAMRDLKMIKNDSPKWLDLKVEQVLEKDKLLERTEVEMAPAENPKGGAQ